MSSVSGHSHLAVIMARGRSQRMGRPKGLCRLPGEERGFLQILAEVYLAAGFPVLVVTNDDDLPAYQGEVSHPAVSWIAAGTDGDTARTALLAFAEQPSHTSYWLQPVDMPLLTRATLDVLLTAGEQEPDRIIRPALDGNPGHPVVVPAAVLGRLRKLADEQPPLAEKPLRVIIQAAVADRRLVAPLLIDVPDPGVTRDFDTPQDLEI